MRPDSCAEIAVDAGQVKFVIQRKQHVGDSHITEKETRHRLHISHIRTPHHARYRDKSHSGDRGAEHAERDHVPGRLVLPLEKCRVRTSSMSGDTGY